MKFRHPPMRSTSPVLVLICRIRFAHLGGQRRPTAAADFTAELRTMVDNTNCHWGWALHPSTSLAFSRFFGYIYLDINTNDTPRKSGRSQEEWFVMPRICKVELYRCFQHVLPPTWIQYLPATPVLVIWFTISKPNTVTKFLHKRMKSMQFFGILMASWQKRASKGILRFSWLFKTRLLEL